MSRVRFIFCAHIHQPVGNFAHVMQLAHDDCYRPFLEIMERHPDIPFCMHASGPLLEWIEGNRVDTLIRIRRMVEAGRLELLGGGFYEPILTGIPPEDARGQIAMMEEALRKWFETRPRGVWLAERIWEPSLPSLLKGAGVDYTVVDDQHFLAAGMPEDQIDGYYLAEDHGSLVAVFPLREPLRYMIPFAPPEKTIEFLLSRPGGRRPPIVVYADDGEKFGHWPGTRRLMEQERWLDRFLDALAKQKDDIEVTTFSRVLDAEPARGRFYLPSTSYREMGEWTLPARAEGAKAPAGQWRNFRVKYEEVNILYGRMLDVSRRVRAMNPRSSARRAAERELYRSQCNCAHWHGVFGGLYLPHLRESVYHHLIRAESATEEPSEWGAQETDIDLDGRPDVRLYNPSLSLLALPARGGQVAGWDVRERCLNLGATLARRPETYHAQVKSAKVEAVGEEGKSIHHLHAAKEAGLAQKLVYDALPRFSLVDRFLRPNVDAEIGTFATAAFDARVTREDRHVRLAMTGRGTVAGEPVEIRKEIALDRAEPEFQVQYRIAALGRETVEARFGVEFNISFLNEGVVKGGESVKMAEAGTVAAPREFWIEDAKRRLALSCFLSRGATVKVEPVESVSISERGFERNYQGTALTPFWPVTIAPGQPWTVVMTWRVHLRE